MRKELRYTGFPATQKYFSINELIIHSRIFWTNLVCISYLQYFMKAYTKVLLIKLIVSIFIKRASLFLKQSI